MLYDTSVLDATPLPPYPPGLPPQTSDSDSSQSQLESQSRFTSGGGGQRDFTEMSIPPQYRDRIEFSPLARVFHYFADRRKKWPFTTTPHGAQLLCRMFAANAPVFAHCQEQMLLRSGPGSSLAAQERQGEEIYSRKPNKGSSTVTWSQHEYGLPGTRCASKPNN